jgi:hypothetical protein
VSRAYWRDDLRTTVLRRPARRIELGRWGAADYEPHEERAVAELLETDGPETVELLHAFKATFEARLLTAAEQAAHDERIAAREREEVPAHGQGRTVKGATAAGAEPAEPADQRRLL